jgi:N-acetylglucosaminyldiphosphoundecaprenol N-acetyl-beta-D-mannosaminyltransferase
MSTATPNGRISLLGCPIDRLDMQRTVARCLAAIDNRGYTQHMAMNAAKLVAYQQDDELRSIVAGCRLVSADGKSLVWAARALGEPLPERVAGIDLMHELLAAAARRGDRVFILGARPEVLERAVERIRALHPGIVIAGRRDGYFGDAGVAAVCDEIRSARADMLFVAMSSPAKERFLGAHGADLGVPLVMGVGGAIDVIAGVARRAPAPWQRAGVEWLYRLLQEPLRLGPRYLRTNGRFMALVAREWWQRR